MILPKAARLSLLAVSTSLLLVGLAAPPPVAAANFPVRVINNAFIPRNLTIQVGDTVTWTNEGVLHNVRADDNSFRCANGCDGEGGNGTPASNAWVVTLTFDEAGVVPYFCEAHGAPGNIGMAGTITVEGAPANPGRVTFSAPNFPVTESVGSARVRVDRVEGADGTVSVRVSTSNGTATAPSDYASASEVLSWNDGESGPRFFPVEIVDDGQVEPQERFNVTLTDVTGGAGIGRGTATVTINDNDQENGGDPGNPGEPGQLRFQQTIFRASEADGTATVVVERVGGSGGAVSAQLTANGGTATEDADYTPVTTTVNFADGDTSAKQVTVPILQDAEDEGAETINLRLSNATGGAALVAPADQGAVNQEPQVAILDDEGLDACSEADGLTLCLGEGGRFKVQVSFRNFVNRAEGTTVTDRGDNLPLNRDSGLFTFFDPNNAELLVKVIEGCVITQHWWVFLAGTTNVEYTLTVTDTERQEVFFTTNPLDRTAVTVLDTQALDTCP